jgi:hypothetical protein
LLAVNLAADDNDSESDNKVASLVVIISPCAHAHDSSMESRPFRPCGMPFALPSDQDVPTKISPSSVEDHVARLTEQTPGVAMTHDLWSSGIVFQPSPVQSQSNPDILSTADTAHENRRLDSEALKCSSQPKKTNNKNSHAANRN